MKTSDRLTFWGTAIGLFATTIGSSLALSFKIGRVHEKVLGIEQEIPVIKSDIRQMQSDITGLKVEMSEMRFKVDALWRHYLSKSNSPMVLNEAGLQALERSNIRRFADKYYAEILSKVRDTRPVNSYQAQEALILIVSNYRHVTECQLMLQEAAFSSGYDVESLLFVAALTIRDRILSELGFK